MVDIDDDAEIKIKILLPILDKLGYQYCAYKSRNGYHVSIIKSKEDYFLRDDYVSKVWNIMGYDAQLASKNKTISLEWQKHWKDNSFTITPIKVTQFYSHFLLGGEV